MASLTDRFLRGGDGVFSYGDGRDHASAGSRPFAGALANGAAEQRAFCFGEEQRKCEALVGSPTAAEPQQEYQTNYSEAQESSFRLGPTAKGKEKKVIVIAGSMGGRAAAEKIYRHLMGEYADLLKESAEYYRNSLAQTVSVDL